jgi:hypothetical protein
MILSHDYPMISLKLKTEEKKKKIASGKLT